MRLKFRETLWGCATLTALACGACSSSSGGATPDAGAPPRDAAEAEAEPPPPLPPFMPDASILIDGLLEGTTSSDCRTGYCRHNENTDLIQWAGSIWLVHRSAISQQLGPNSALHVYQSTDDGASFKQVAFIDAPSDRDIRDPSFFVVGSDLYMKALERLPVLSTRDSNVDTMSVVKTTHDGKTWTADQEASPHGWSFWRVKEYQGVYYSAAYQDGDLQVVLYSSTDGLHWTMGPQIYGVAAETPLETELTFMPDGELLALVRTDGDDDQLLGDEALQTQVCWSSPPYTAFACPQALTGVRLDGPVSFFWQSRLFVVARKHLGADDKKRTSLYEIGGTLEGGPLTIKEWGQLPSAGDTSYAGVAATDATHFVVSWYSSDLVADPTWVIGMLGPTSIWLGAFDMSKLQ